MKATHWALGAVAVTLLSVSALFAAAGEISLEGVTCLLNPKAPAKADKSVEYKGGKVFFCCDNCPKAFAKDPAKHAVAANTQLVATKQAKQVKCPLSGADCDPSKTAKVSGVEVCFCCDKCQTKVKEADEKAAAELVFSDKAFEKAFKVGKEEEKKKD
jgi:YHS domain-containing protein